MPSSLARVLRLFRVDFETAHGQPSAVQLLIATVAAIAGSLAADAILVAIAIRIFPATKGYEHFQFSDYGKLTVIGVLIACLGWPVVTRVSSQPRWLFVRLAVLVTLVLWLPDLYLLHLGQSPRAVAVLMVMHLAIAVITYNCLVRIARVRPGQARAVTVLFGEPLAVKVPEITALFWIIKLLTTAGGEATSDYLALGSHLVGAAVEVGVLVVGLVWQFSIRRYTAAAYWFLAYAIAIFGTGVSDTLHLTVGIPYAGTTLLWAVVLAIIFAVWYRREGTLSIHSIVTRRREMFYWATVFATFALGTALGDFTAMTLGLGYFSSVVLFFVVILIPLVAWRFGLNAIAAFWFAYVITRPLGASIADYVSKARSLSGAGFGDGRTALVVTAAVAVGVVYLAVTRRDIQPEDAAGIPPLPPVEAGSLPGGALPGGDARAVPHRAAPDRYER
ncbi:MAG TPA: DUF6069 family protein [Streptosporangiaceae bacterium]